MRGYTLATVVVGSAFFATMAQAEIKVGFVTSLSGGAAALGIPYGKGMKAGQAYKPQVGSESIKVIELDDASDPSAATRNARKLVEEENVDILIGTSTVPASIAMISVAKELKVPMIAISPINPTDTDQWGVTIPQSPALMGKVIAQRMKRDGKTKIGSIGFSDSWGDLVYDGAKQAEADGLIKVLTNERYARTDTSVTGQILKILATQPDGILIGASSTQAALPLIELAKRGYKGGLYGLAPLVNADFVRVGGKSVEGVKVTIGPVVVAEQLPDSHYAKALSMAFRSAYQKANGEATTDGFSAYSFDAWLVFTSAAERALRQAKPGTAEFRTRLRDEILQTKELPGVHAVYNFAKGSSYGVDERSLVIVQLVNGVWKYEP